MADVGITNLRNVTSEIIKSQEERYSKERSPFADQVGNDGTFALLFDKARENINTTNSYLSDAENEEIKWALGETDSTHDLTIALSKASTALQYTVAIRDRVLEAYNTIMQMQI
ncbi:MAG: flagellar hook-basal body complex protein FliE [Butyrivibrio sp.]|nr:flagellar hook-basal body complex protein FliE [Butyrivibrio sp.]